MVEFICPNCGWEVKRWSLFESVDAYGNVIRMEGYINECKTYICMNDKCFHSMQLLSDKQVISKFDKGFWESKDHNIYEKYKKSPICQQSWLEFRKAQLEKSANSRHLTLEVKRNFE